MIENFSEVKFSFPNSIFVKSSTDNCYQQLSSYLWLQDMNSCVFGL